MERKRKRALSLREYIKMESTEKRGTIGREHIVHQEGDVVYYPGFIFDRNPYYNVTVPILVSDILRLLEDSQKLCGRYYGYENRVLFFLNHPLKKLSVVGTVVGCRYKRIAEDDYLLIQLDDCSGSNRFLQCKCLENIALENRIYWGSIRGQVLKITGFFNVWYREMEVEWIKIITDMIVEIDHWKNAIEFRHKLSIPWVEPVSSDLPNDTASCNYIRQMHTTNILESLVIASHYEGSDHTVTPPRSCQINRGSIKDLKVEFMRSLLRHQSKRAYTVELYGNLSTLLEELATVKFQNQKVGQHVKPLSQLKTESFLDQLCELQKLGLVQRQSNDNLIDLKPLKDLHEYSMHRILTLIKLECNVGRVDYNYIRDKIRHLALTKKAIINIFKESLRSISFLYPQLLAGWWMDVGSNEYSLIHFKYDKPEILEDAS